MLVAAAGFCVPTLSVAGGVAGAIDSLATLSGFRADLSSQEIRGVLAKANLAYVGHRPGGWAAADAVLWKLRERTGTKPVADLIAASLLSKKLAMGVLHGVVDVRVGPAGNAGSDFRTSLETAYEVIGVAGFLGMRVGCVLSDARELGWPSIGRIDAILSMLDVLASPAKYSSHEHIQLCVAVAAAACEAAQPSVPFDTWRQQVERGLSDLTAEKMFKSACIAQGASKDAFDRLRELAMSRTTIAVDLPPGALLDVSKLSEAIKLIRSRMPKEDHAFLGVNAAEPRSISVLLPPSSSHLVDTARDALSSAVRREPAHATMPPLLAKWDWQLQPIN